jgi:hypothetical protein
MQTGNYRSKQANSALKQMQPLPNTSTHSTKFPPYPYIVAITKEVQTVVEEGM